MPPPTAPGAATATALFFLPLPANTPASPLANLTSHVLRSFPGAIPLAPFTLDHRLLVSTASVLPGSPPSQRRYTQFLQLSHVAGKTFLGTSSVPSESPVPDGSPASHPMTLVTIPAGPPTDAFYDLTLKKLAPQWSPRMNLRVDNGSALLLGPSQEWTLRLGDLRVTSGRAAQVQGSTVRGIVVEVAYLGAMDEDDDDEGARWAEQEQSLRAFFTAVVRGSGVGLDGLRVVCQVPGTASTEPASWVLTRQYMELLRFARN